MAIWGHYVTMPLWKREGVANRLDLTVVVQYFVGIDKLSVILEHVYARQYFLNKPVLHLVIS
jgi:hypothetical protein